MPTSEPQPASFPAKVPVPRTSEWLGVLLLLAGFLILNILTYNRYPQVWCDEVWFSEPAVNMAKEGEFHTRGFMFQPPHTFPIINCPLYLMVQVPWVAVVGTSVQSIRSFNYVLMFFAGFFVWVASWRLNLLRSSWVRLLLIVSLYAGYGMSYAYRSSRPDILGMNCLLLLLLSFTIPRRFVREILIFFLSAVAVWIGLQVALYAAFACFLAMLFLRVVRLRELFVLGAGLATGAVTMAGLLWWKNVLINFLVQIFGIMGRRYAHGHLPLGTRVHRVVSSVLIGNVEDFSAALLLLGLAVLLFLGWRRLSRPTRALNTVCLILILATPLLFDIVGHWAFYYSYLRFVPALFALFVTATELMQVDPLPSRPRLYACVWLASIAAAMAAGLPSRLAIAFTQYHLPPRTEIARILKSNIRPDDVALSDFSVFFEVKQAASEVYDPNYSATLGHIWTPGGHEFTPEEKRSMSVLVIRAAQMDQFTNYFGGEWIPVGPPFGDAQDYSALTRLPVIGHKFAHYSLQPQNERYPVQILRRTPSPGIIKSP